MTFNFTIIQEFANKRVYGWQMVNACGFAEILEIFVKGIITQPRIRFKDLFFSARAPPGG